MRKIIFLLLGLYFMCDITGNNVAYSFAVAKPIHSPVLLKYVKGSDFIKLSFKEFATLTGEKENLRNRISFGVMKIRVRHDLKKNPSLTLNEYYASKHKMSTGFKILLWVAGIVLALALILLLIFGGQKT